MKMNHYGITINSEVAITGVVSNNTPEWLNEEICTGINLNYEESIEQLEDDDTLDEDTKAEAIEQWETQSSDTILIGAWIKDQDGKYEPNPEGEYSAICGEVYTQVVQSKFTKRTNLCSPCYPGQGDLDTPGDYLAYDLPPEIYGVQSNG